MFLQIVEWIGKFVSLLNDSTKLSSGKNRRRIGKNLLELHYLLSAIVRNATEITEELERIARHDREGSPGLSFCTLFLRLGDQRQLLKSLQDALRHSYVLMNVYGDNCAEEIEKIAGHKISLIDVITTAALYRVSNLWWGRDPKEEEWIPTSFDLMNVEPFKHLIEARNERHTPEKKTAEGDKWWSHLEDYSEAIFSYPFSGTGEPEKRPWYSRQVGKDRKEDGDTVRKLLAEIHKMDAIARLSAARDTVAGILRSNFKIDEIF